MRKQTFYDWLTREIASSRMALVKLYETRDRLLYVEAPPLRQQYMALFGEVEEPVLQAELEVSLLRHKLELIRIAINRREKIDLEQIEADLQQERESRVTEVENEDLTLHELPELSEQESHTMQRQYREITNMFHPAMNPDITDTQKELFEKAVEAYKMQDTEQMKLIHDMLLAPSDISVQIAPASQRSETEEERREFYSDLASVLTTDYSLAKKLYDCFAPLEEDRVVRSAYLEYEEQRKAVEQEIEQIRAGFPFNAVSTMNDRSKTEDYLAELRIRMRRSKEERAELEKKIAELTEAQAHG